LPTQDLNDVSDQQTTLQLHIAEYQTLTSRNTYYIYIASSIWPMLILLFVLVVPLWNTATSMYILWFMSIATEFVLFMWAENSYLQYENIYYIEYKLRPLIARQLPKEQFWMYEGYLADKRKKDIQWWEAYPAWASLGVFVSMSCYRGYAIAAQGVQGRNWLEAILCIICCFLFVAIIQKSRDLIKLRRSTFPEYSQLKQ